MLCCRESSYKYRRNRGDFTRADARVVADREMFLIGLDVEFRLSHSIGAVGKKERRGVFSVIAVVYQSGRGKPADSGVAICRHTTIEMSPCSKLCDQPSVPANRVARCRVTRDRGDASALAYRH